jgi:hypothetical protein
MTLISSKKISRGTRRTRRRALIVACSGLATLSFEVSANAATAPVCNPGVDESGCCYKAPNPVFVAGTSAAKSALQAIAKQLTNISIIYQTPDSCIALDDMANTKAATGTNVVTTNLSVTVTAADNTTSNPACALSAAAAVDATTHNEAIDIAVSDIFPATCQTNVGFGGITTGKQIDVLGPIQGQTIDVPSASKATSISAEAAYVLFGYGANTYTVSPWNVPANVFIRPSTSGTLNMIGTVIGLRGTKWANATTTNVNVETSSANMFTAIATAPANIDATVGILSAQFVLQQDAVAVKAGTPTIKTLAFQNKGQTCGYFPDSTANKGDKLNVRQGRYSFWGPAHLAANVGNDGNPTGPHAAAVAAVLNAFIGTGCEGVSCPPGTSGLLGGADAVPTTALKKAVIDAESKPSGGVVPWCAMQVTRGNVEAGPTAPYKSSTQCGCYFESLAAGATVSDCKACPNGNECTGNTICSYGYCEAK